MLLFCVTRRFTIEVVDVSHLFDIGRRLTPSCGSRFAPIDVAIFFLYFQCQQTFVNHDVFCVISVTLLFWGPCIVVPPVVDNGCFSSSTAEALLWWTRLQAEEVCSSAYCSVVAFCGCDIHVRGTCVKERQVVDNGAVFLPGGFLRPSATHLVRTVEALLERGVSHFSHCVCASLRFRHTRARCGWASAVYTSTGNLCSRFCLDVVN